MYRIRLHTVRKLFMLGDIVIAVIPTSCRKSMPFYLFAYLFKFHVMLDTPLNKPNPFEMNLNVFQI